MHSLKFLSRYSTPILFELGGRQVIREQVLLLWLRRGSVYTTSRELGPKIPFYRRNYRSQLPNGCICGPSGLVGNKGVYHRGVIWGLYSLGPDCQQTLRVLVPKKTIPTQNVYYNYYYQNPKYVIIGYLVTWTLTIGQPPSKFYEPSALDCDRLRKCEMFLDLKYT